MEEEKLLKRRRKAQKDNNEAVLISACTDLADLYRELGRLEFALEEYTTLANLYKKQNKKLEFGVVNRGLGEVYLGLHKFETALHHLKIYYETAKELNNKLEEQRALATIGHTYLVNYLDCVNKPDKSYLNSANKFFMKSLHVCESLSGEVSKVEVADMSARLFCNLGLVQDCLGQFDKAKELIIKSITLCKSNDLYEQLQRGYMSLASVFEKQKDSRSAIQQYNCAVETAKKLRDKPSQLAEALLGKSELLIKLGDFHGAKSTLVKAYKLKIPNQKERISIENKLRVVASMCKNEDKTLTTPDSDFPTLKKLYEKMGDGACELKNYQKAIDYYQKMLDCALKAGLSDEDLATCYYSLAETFKDDGRYEEAVDYFEKEFDLCRKLKDKLNTLSKIADTKESAECAVSEVQKVYMKAVKCCQEEGNVHEEGRMLKRFIIYLRRQNKFSEAFKFQQELDKLDYLSSDSDGESSTQTGSVIGGEINLDEITDMSEDSDTDHFTPIKPRRRAKTNIAKKNQKGETPLHTACIKGQLNIVRHLLEQGHPVNVRDYCGWLPLHEACNYGYYDIVKLLLEKGAAINDRGGKGCAGVTPLHDAAFNGHLQVMHLLLSRGANPLVKTDSGESVLDYLSKWRDTQTDLSGEDETLYNLLINQITQALDKTGQNKESETVSQKKLNLRTKSFEDMRRSTTVGLEEEPVASKFTDDYRSVMNNLKHRNDKPSPKKVVPKTKRPALISESEMVDNWLENDLLIKKRKTVISQRSTIDLDDYHPMDFEDNSMPSTSKSPAKMTIKRRHQAKLTSFGLTKSFVEADSTSSPRSKSTRKSIEKQILPKFDNSSLMTDPMLCVDVRINEKLYRVPVLLSQINTHTIKWLASEAAARYAKKEYMVPVLELETKSGAILADDDLISLLFPMGASQSEEVTARIIKWNVPPLIDRYKKACQDMGVEFSTSVSQMLQEFFVLDLSHKGLKGPALAPLCKVLNRQTNLQELDLSGNFLTNDCVHFLAASLTSLQNLYKLNLNCTSLSSEQLRILSNKLDVGDRYKVTDLDLSDNVLDDQSLESLALITRHFELKQFNLSLNKLSFSHNKDVTLNLHQVEEFDISDNDLKDDAIMKILSWLKPRTLKSLNLSRNSASGAFLRETLSDWGNIDDLRLVTLKLSRCGVQDSDLFDLLRLIDSLENLDLSYNNELTSISLRRLLQADGLRHLNLYGCGNILKYFTVFSKYVQQPLDEQHKVMTIKLTTFKNDTRNECLVNFWKNLYGNRALTEQNSRMLCLSVLE